MPRAPFTLRSRVFRSFAALFAVLHLTVAPAVAYADGRGAAAASTIAASGHIESEGGVPHRALHHDDCALCQFLSVVGASASPHVPAVRSAARIGAPFEPVSLAARADALGEHLSRAPPTLV